MTSFQAKIVWKRPRKRENKNYRFVMFLPDAVQKIPKKQQKNSKKLKKYHYGSISSHHRLKEDETGGNEKLSFRSVPT